MREAISESIANLPSIEDSLRKPADSRSLLPVPQRRELIWQFASEEFEKGPDWLTFFREVLGVDGIIQTLLTSDTERLEFERTEEYATIMRMVAALRERSTKGANCDEPTRVITVRLPQSVHDSLRSEAQDKRTSMNQLCISKLLQMIHQS